MPQRRHVLAMLAALFVGVVACTKPAPPTANNIIPSDRVAPSPVGTTQTVLQKTFNLKGSAAFPFEIPAHSAQPHLHGIFESFAGQVHGASDETANIDFVILSEEQQTDSASHRASEAMFSVEASHNQAVNFDLPPSLNHPVKYYLVFRDPNGKDGKVVEANFRVDF
ncbi:MAG: hypothetical protein WA830_01835 [Candidatus Sulfotelmatobacter sp.]